MEVITDWIYDASGLVAAPLLFLSPSLSYYIENIGIAKALN